MDRPSRPQTTVSTNAYPPDSKNTAALTENSQSQAINGGAMQAWKPSVYKRDRLMTTAERLAIPNTKHQTKIIEFTNNDQQHRDFKVPVDQPLFKPIPSEVVLQNFTPYQTYEVLISFRNVDKVSSVH
jgi:hypothetical protein